jgi:probable F420-dependent oxidoreductase
MKIRIGISPGLAARPEELPAVVEQLERDGVDSLWLSEMVYGPLVEPFVGMTWALARTTHLKVGFGVAVLPGRNPVLVAKQLVSMAALAPKRVLPVFGLQPARRGERAQFPAPPGRRAALFDESLQLLRLLLTGDEVSFSGEFFTVEGAQVGPKPAKPLDVWLGGSAPAAMTRIGRYADGWLGSFRSPAEAAGDVAAIRKAADEAGREIEDDHYGISLGVYPDGLTPELIETAARRRPGVDPASLAPTSWAAARAMIEGYIEAGLSKFVVRPGSPGMDVSRFIDEFRAELQPLEN